MLKINIEQVIDTIKSSKSIAEVNEKIGYDRKSSSGYRRIRNIIRKHQLDISHFTGQLWSKGKTSFDDDRVCRKYRLEDIFIEKSKVSRFHVKTLIIRKGLIKYECSECKIVDWNQKKLSLHLEHKNGIRSDNRLENLTFLCPNCHSQTETYCGKKSVNTKRVEESQIVEAAKTCCNIRQILLKLGMSDGANYRRIKDILLKNNIKLTPV